MSKRVLLSLVVVSCIAYRTAHGEADAGTDKLMNWRAGAASVVITPQQSMWMAGYAARDKPSEGKVHDLHAKALALEDAPGDEVRPDYNGFAGAGPVFT